MTLSRILNPAIGLALLLVAGNAQAADLFNGTIEAVKTDGIVLKVGNVRHTIQVNADTKITLDGKAAKLAELKSTKKAKVTAELKGKRLVATRIEARSQASGQFAVADIKERLFEGKIDAVSEKQLVLLVKRKLYKFKINDATLGTLNKKPAKLTDLKKGTPATVTARLDGNQWVATKVAATLKVGSGQFSVVDFARLKRVSGMIKRKSDDRFQLFVTVSKTTYTVVASDKMTVNIDGKKSSFDQLKVGLTAVVIGEKSKNKLTAKTIVAVSRT